MMTDGDNQTVRAMRCLDCGYDLREFAEHRCPECGRGFDPTKPETFLQQPVWARCLLIIAIASVPIMAWPIVAARLGWTRQMPIWLMPLGHISIISGLTIAWEAARRSISILRSRHPWVEHRWAALPAAIIGVTIVAVFLLSTMGVLLYDWLIK